MKGESEEWTSGLFTEQRFDVKIPENATHVHFKIGSNIGEGGSDGEVYLDDLKIEH